MKKYIITLLIICSTIVLLAAIGGWVYIQRQSIAQRNAANLFNQQNSIKELKYQECEQNNRAAEASNSKFSSLFVNNCDLIL